MKILVTVIICMTLITGCSSQTAPAEKPHLLTTPRVHANYVWMLAKTTGVLTVVNGCVAIQGPNSVARTLVFAPDYTITMIDGKWLIKDSLGGSVGSIGEQVEVGGGESATLNFSDSSGCQGPFWIASPADRREWVPPGAKAPPIPSDS